MQAVSKGRFQVWYNYSSNLVCIQDIVTNFILLVQPSGWLQWQFAGISSDWICRFLCFSLEQHLSSQELHHYPLRIDSTAVPGVLLQGCVFLLPSFFFYYYSNGTRCQNSLKISASLRILASLLTVPFPWEAKSRMWGYEVFFPVAQLVLAAPLFIMVMASQQKRMSSSGEVGALSFILSRSPSVARPSHSQLV